MRRRDEILVGMLTLAALVVIVVGVIWLSRGGLQKGYPLYAKFPWGANLKQGQPVLLAGVQVGYVDDAQLLETEGAVVVTMRIQSTHHVPKNTTAAVVPSGIFGDVAIALTPRAPSPIAFQPGDTVPSGRGAPGLSDLTARFDTISRTVQGLTNEMRRQLVDDGGIADLRRTMASANRLAAELSVIAARQSRDLSLTMASFRQTAGSITAAANTAAAAVDTAQIGGTLRNLRATSANAAALSDSLQRTTARVNALLAQAQSGNGTVGKLLGDSLLYADLRRLVTRVDSLTLDFKQNPRKYINLKIF